jgi:hypothetical protein
MRKLPVPTGITFSSHENSLSAIAVRSACVFSDAKFFTQKSCRFSSHLAGAFSIDHP